MPECPDCRVALNHQGFHQVVVDVCPQCHGIWFDAGEIRTISESMGEECFLDDIQPQPVSDEVKAGERTCPRDKAVLNRQNVFGTDGVIIDVCPKCHGTWLEMGELAVYVKRLKEVDHIPCNWPGDVQQELEHIRQAEDLDLKRMLGKATFVHLVGRSFQEVLVKTQKALRT